MDIDKLREVKVKVSVQPEPIKIDNNRISAHSMSNMISRLMLGVDVGEKVPGSAPKYSQGFMDALYSNVTKPELGIGDISNITKNYATDLSKYIKSNLFKPKGFKPRLFKVLPQDKQSKLISSGELDNDLFVEIGSAFK